MCGGVEPYLDNTNLMKKSSRYPDPDQDSAASKCNVCQIVQFDQFKARQWTFSLLLSTHSQLRGTNSIRPCRYRWECSKFCCEKGGSDRTVRCYVKGGLQVLGSDKENKHSESHPCGRMEIGRSVSPNFQGKMNPKFSVSRSFGN
ncbi:unnamed protein product [Linum tenue]|uniref:Uncharacterized protein n=1 Tax=Linum tenue TaxID=586396 RepID=A0AAV0NEY3_9ROSI|nr:unnamed protein product [Linum tenue]